MEIGWSSIAVIDLIEINCTAALIGQVQTLTIN
jgi:hypothetical protein